MLKVGEVKEIYGMKGAGYSIREIARELDISPNTVRRYLKDPEAVMPKVRRRRAFKLDPFIEYMDLRLSEGLENCVALWPELQGLGYQGGYSPVKTDVSPRRRRRQVSGDGAVRDGAGGTGTGGLGELQLFGRKGAEGAGVGLRDGALLVPVYLRGRTLRNERDREVRGVQPRNGRAGSEGPFSSGGRHRFAGRQAHPLPHSRGHRPGRRRFRGPTCGTR